MTGLTLLIIGGPVALWRLASRLGKKQEIQPAPKQQVGKVEDWAWPPKWRDVSRPGVRS